MIALHWMSVTCFCPFYGGLNYPLLLKTFSLLVVFRSLIHVSCICVQVLHSFHVYSSSVCMFCTMTKVKMLCSAGPLLSVSYFESGVPPRTLSYRIFIIFTVLLCVTLPLHCTCVISYEYS